MTSAQYQQNYTYDTNGRLTSAQSGYTYGDSHHLHAVTSTGSGYSAAYDAAGNMTCRAPSSTTTCSGTQTGQRLSYDPEGHLSTWQNQPSPTSTVNYLYDGEGTRVASQLVSGGNTTLTSYLGKLETIVAGSSSTTTTYYFAGALRIAEAVNGTFSYLGNDVLGSTAVALNASGQLTAAQLYGPYGNVRYSSGTMPTDIGFTGQRGDSATGLDYYDARYYDPVVGLFISADTVLPGGGFDPWGLSRYAYVKGDPETLTDPSGHSVIDISEIRSAGSAAGAGLGELIGQAIGAGFLWLGARLGISPVTETGASESGRPTHPSDAGGALQGAVVAAAAGAEGVAAGIFGGMDGRPRAWDKPEQGDLVRALDGLATAYRQAQIKKGAKGAKGSNGGAGVLNIWDSTGALIFNGAVPKLGFRDGTHSEELLIEWAKDQIAALVQRLAQTGKTLVGATINMLIFSQTDVCDVCMSQLNSGIWLNRLYNATGLPPGAATVNLDVWQWGFDVPYISRYSASTKG